MNVEDFIRVELEKSNGGRGLGLPERGFSGFNSSGVYVVEILDSKECFHNGVYLAVDLFFLSPRNDYVAKYPSSTRFFGIDSGNHYVTPFKPDVDFEFKRGVLLNFPFSGETFSNLRIGELESVSSLSEMRRCGSIVKDEISRIDLIKKLYCC